jgi:protein gp37
VWVGVSAENQQWADIRIPALLDTPAALRWVSAEPLLGALDLTRYLWPTRCPAGCACRRPLDPDKNECGCSGPCTTGELWTRRPPGIGWVVVGGESGHGARPVDLDCIEDVVGVCDEDDVPVFVKQLGSAWAKSHVLTGRGDDPDQWPANLRIRQFPQPNPSTTPGRLA